MKTKHHYRLSLLCILMGSIFTSCLRSSFPLEAGKKMQTSKYHKNINLCQAAESGDVESIQDLIAQGADVNGVNDDGYTPLHITAKKGDVESIQDLIAQGADVNGVNDDGYTPLHITSEKGNLKATKVLTEANANVNATNNNGQTPLHLAALGNNIEMVKLLIQSGSSKEFIDENRKRPFDLATDEEIKKLLVPSTSIMTPRIG